MADVHISQLENNRQAGSTTFTIQFTSPTNPHFTGGRLYRTCHKNSVLHTAMQAASDSHPMLYFSRLGT